MKNIIIYLCAFLLFVGFASAVVVNENACFTYGASDTVYNVTQNIVTDGLSNSCIMSDLAGDYNNVTIECNGFSIINTLGTSVGILEADKLDGTSTTSNITFQNCKLLVFDADPHAIYFSDDDGDGAPSPTPFLNVSFVNVSAFNVGGLNNIVMFDSLPTVGVSNFLGIVLNNVSAFNPSGCNNSFAPSGFNILFPQPDVISVFSDCIAKPNVHVSSVVFANDSLSCFANITTSDASNTGFYGTWYLNNKQFSTFNTSLNSFVRLNKTDSADWARTLTIAPLAYDAINNLVYIYGNGKFGVYNAFTNIGTDLSTEVTLGDVSSATYDAIHNLFYFASSTDSTFSFYNVSENLEHSILTIPDGDLGGSRYSMVYDDVHNLVYIRGVNVYVYNPLDNSLNNLSITPASFFNNIQSSMAYDGVNNLLYIIGGTSNIYFSVFNASNNVTQNLNGAITGFLSSSGAGTAIMYDSAHNLVYLSLGSNFAIYNASDNRTYDLHTLVGNMTGGKIRGSLVYDSIHDMVFSGGEATVGSSLNFGVYNHSDGSATLISSDTAGRIVFDSIHDVVYYGTTSSNGKFTAYRHFLPDFYFGGVSSGSDVEVSRLQNFSLSAGQNWTCSVSAVSNSLGASMQRSASVSVSSSAPVLNDTTAPSIFYIPPTDSDGSVLESRDFFFVSVNASDANFANSTIYVFDSGLNLVFHQTVSSEINLVNFTVPSLGVYYFNASAVDTSGNSNHTALFSVTVQNPPVSTGFVGGSAPPPSSNCASGFAWNGVSCVKLASNIVYELVVSLYNHLVNVEDVSALSFNVSYLENGVLKDSDAHFVDVLDENKTVLEHVELYHVSTGVYGFAYDFFLIPKGSYTLSIHVGAQSEDDKVSVMSFPAVLGFFYDDGVLNIAKVAIAIVIIGGIISFMIYGFVQLIKTL